MKRHKLNRSKEASLCCWCCLFTKTLSVTKSCHSFFAVLYYEHMANVCNKLYDDGVVDIAS